VIIIFILCNRAKQNNFRETYEKRTEKYSVSCHQKILIPRCSSVIRIGYRSTWNSCPIYMCEIFRLTPPKATSLTIFFLRRSAYPLYSLYSILRPIWTGECKYPSLSYRFYDFYDRFHYTVEVRSHERGNNGISTGAGPHCEARVNGLKTVRTYCRLYRAHYGALTSSIDK